MYKKNESVVRDRVKTVNYFDQFISEDSNRIKKFISKLNAGEVREERKMAVIEKIHDLSLGILVAKYSRGDSLHLLKKEYLQLFEEWEEVFESNYYNKNLKMISLAILFNAGNSVFKKIRKMLFDAKVCDWLFEFLLNSSLSKTTDDTIALLFPDAFDTLKKVVYSENKLDLLEKYLKDEWYNEDCGCYEAHKSNQNIYYGYWSFEAGAIAKILQIDDETLKNTPFYPYDLVHYESE